MADTQPFVDTKQNQIPNEPSLKDLLDLHKKTIMLALSCHHIGTIQSFDATKQTATATINYKKTYYELNEQTRVYAAKLRDYPILVDCPAIILGGGLSSLTFPITQGDECLVIFNDRDLDNWFQNGAGGPVGTPRLHSFSDAMVLVGVRSVGNVIADYDTARAVLRNGNAGVGVGEELIKIYNETYTLNQLLQSLLTTLQALTSAISVIKVSGVTAGGADSGFITNAGTFSDLGDDLSDLADQIGDLLE